MSTAAVVALVIAGLVVIGVPVGIVTGRWLHRLSLDADIRHLIYRQPAGDTVPVGVDYELLLMVASVVHEAHAGRFAITADELARLERILDDAEEHGPRPGGAR